MSVTIKDFCRLHGACAEGAKWALSCGASTMAELWARDDVKPEWRVWIATRPGVLTDRELRLFACWCCRQQVWHLLTDERLMHVVEVAELYAEGKATSDELAEAWAAACDVAEDVAGAEASAVAGAAAWDMAQVAAGDTAWDKTQVAAGDEARYAAGEAAGDVAWDAARAAQAAYLEEHAHPSF